MDVNFKFRLLNSVSTQPSHEFVIICTSQTHLHLHMCLLNEPKARLLLLTLSAHRKQSLD